VGPKVDRKLATNFNTKMAADPHAEALAAYQRKLDEHNELEARVRAMREEVKTAKDEYDLTEQHLRALQNVG
jgi:26S proteasome regulatory subunit T4